ncbi:MAG: phosphoribosylformylglycinamidine synthase subunit PurS, partial [Opitutales bacterium]|nr:phosphoribosylformylglycinamidine synthase subunit PurS [Opitutales bacterium]
MINRIEVFSKPEFPDVHAGEVLADIKQLGIESAASVQSMRVFLIESKLDNAGLERIAKELLADPVTEQYFIGNSNAPVSDEKVKIIEVHLQPGVTDPVASSAMMAINDMNLEVDSVRTGRKYFISGSLSGSEVQTIAQRILANDCIEEVIFDNLDELPCPHVEPYKLEKITVPLCNLSVSELVELSKSSDLFLDEREMLTIQEYYKSIDRDPTDIELEMIAQTWSEHCVHKTFRGTIELTEKDADGKELNKTVVENMMKSYLAKATNELAKPWCISVFVDNSGVVEFDDEYGVCFKVETHNHPSAIEP